MYAAASAPVCRRCRAGMRRAAPLTVAGVRCWAAFEYEGPAGAVVRALKFGARRAVADAMAAQLAAHAPAELLRGVIVPVPVHPAHARRRGIDHGAVLAGALSRRSGLPWRACLTRGGDPRPQVGRTRAQRVLGPAGELAVSAHAPPTALLVDDVVTTGATLAACVAALRSAGTAQIAAVVYARTTAR